MDSKSIVIGIFIGILLGATGVYIIDQSKIDKLNKAVEDLKTGIDGLNEALDAKQQVIDAQEEALEVVSALEEEIEAKELLIQGYEEYKENADDLIEKMTNMVDTLNILYAAQTYRAEEALTLLHDFRPEYEPKINFIAVYGDLSFEDWWEINSGPAEEWLSLVYG